MDSIRRRPFRFGVTSINHTTLASSRHSERAAACIAGARFGSSCAPAVVVGAPMSPLDLSVLRASSCEVEYVDLNPQTVSYVCFQKNEWDWRTFSKRLFVNLGLSSVADICGLLLHLKIERVLGSVFK